MELENTDAQILGDSSSPAKLCNICGDPGFEEMLATCSECRLSAEHIYCMQTLVEVVPVNAWICECCKFRKELKPQNLANCLVESIPPCSNFVKSKASNENQSSNLAEAGKSQIGISEPTNLASVTQAEGIAGDVSKVSKSMPSFVGTATSQQSIGLGESQKILSKQNSLKVSNSPKVKCLSPIISDNFKGGKEINVAGMSSRKLSTPANNSPAMGSPKPNSEKLCSLITRNPEWHDGKVPVSRTYSGNLLQLLHNRPVKHVDSPRSLYKDLPSFLLNVKPEILKGRALPSGKIPGGVHTLQIGQKLLAANSVPAQISDTKEYLSHNISPEPYHSNRVEISIGNKLNPDQILPDNRLMLDTSPKNSSPIDQKMSASTDSRDVTCAGVPPVKDTIFSKNACGDLCAAESEKEAGALLSNPSKALADAPGNLNSEGCEPECLVHVSEKKSACLSASCIKVKGNKEGTPVLSETSEFQVKSCMQSMCKDDGSNHINVVNNVNPATAGSTLFMGGSKDHSEVGTKISLRSVISDLNVSDRDNQQSKGALHPWCSNPDFSLERTRRYKSQEIARSTQVKSRFNNHSSFLLQKHKGRLALNACQGTALQSSENSKIEKPILLENDEEDHSVVGVPCKPQLMTSVESTHPLHCSEFDKAHVVHTSCKEVVNLPACSVQLSHCTTSIGIPETSPMQMDYSNIEVPAMASGVSMGLPPPGELVCSNIIDARRILSGKGVITSDTENIRTGPLGMPANFGTTNPRFPTIPEPSCLWRGSFEVIANGKPSLIYNGIVAHVSSRAMDKVSHATKCFPPVLQLEEVERGDESGSWPIQYMTNPPNDESIGLYFFATNNHSFEQYYRGLLDRMVHHDLVLKGAANDAELLIFPSSLLPKQSQYWNRLMYLWGVFRGRKQFKVEITPDTPYGVNLDHGGLKASNAHMAKENIAEVLPEVMSMVMANDDVAGEEDMDVDMEGGKEVGVADRPVKRLTHIFPDSAPSKIEKLLAFPTKKHLAPMSVTLDPYHSNVEVNNLEELDFPPGFGPPTPAAVFPDQPSVYGKCNKIADKEPYLKMASTQAASTGDEGKPSKVSYARAQQSFCPSAKESHPHGNRYSSLDSKSRKFHKGRKRGRDRLETGKYTGRPNYRHRMESTHAVAKDKGKQIRRDCRGRFSDSDRNSYETRGHGKWSADYYPKETRLGRDFLHSRRHKTFHSSSHSRSRSRSRSHLKKRDRSRTPGDTYWHKSEKNRCRRRSGSGVRPKEDFVKLQPKEIEKDELQGVNMGVQASSEGELGRGPLINASCSKQDSCIKNIVNHDIIEGAVEVKDKPAGRMSVPSTIMATNICDSNNIDLTTTDDASKELTSSSDRKQLLPSKFTNVLLSTEEEVSQVVTIASEISSATAKSSFPCYSPVVSVAASNEHVESHARKLDITRHLNYITEKAPFKGHTGICEDDSSILELSLDGNESHQVEPLPLFNEQVGLLKETCNISYQGGTEGSSSMRVGPSKSCGIPKDKFGSLDLSLACPGRTSKEEVVEDSVSQSVNISLKL